MADTKKADRNAEPTTGTSAQLEQSLGISPTTLTHQILITRLHCSFSLCFEPVMNLLPHLIRSICLIASLGFQATQKAQKIASQWLDDTWEVIKKKVLDTAER